MILSLIKTRTATLSLFALSAVLAGAACGSGEDTPAGQDAPVRVVATTYPLEFFAGRIGGDRVLVENPVPAGGDAHSFKPTPGDLRTISAADLLVYNGLGFEPWVDAVLAAGDAPRITVQTASAEGVLMLDEDGDLVLDPHVWLDPVLAAIQVRSLLEGLIEADPEGEAVYRANTDILVAELNALDERFRARLQSCARDTFITAHDAFNYFAARYGLTAVGIAGINPGAEPSPRGLGDLSTLVEDEGIRYILINPIDSRRLSDTLAKETGAKTLPLHIIQNLTPEQREQGETYFSLMNVNLESVAMTLGCDS